jgi:hypothetical protein
MKRLRENLAIAIAVCGLGTLLFSIAILVLREGREWVALGLFLCAVPLLPLLLLDATLAEYEAGRRETGRVKKDVRQGQPGGIEDDHLMAYGFLSVFAGLVLGVRFDLSFPLALLCGFAAGGVVAFGLAALGRVCDRLLGLIVERFLLPRE